MPTVVREDSGNLEATLTVHIHYADYQKSLDKEISKLQQQAQFKGFRKGKVPASLVTKMYGPGVLIEILDKMVNETLDDYIQKEEIVLVGQPISLDSQRQYAFDPKNKQDYTFAFQIGFAPAFEVQGMDKSSVFHMAVPEITPEMVEKEIEVIQEQHAITSETLPPYEGKDALSFIARELESPGVLKSEGHSSKFTILFEDATDAAREAIIHLEPGNSVELDIFSLENNRDEQFVRRYLLEMDPDDPTETGRLFQLELEGATRRSPRPIDAEFLAELTDSDEIGDEAALRDMIREQLKNSYLQHADFVLAQDLKKFLMDCNPLALPDNHLRRWILASNKNPDPHKLEEAYPEIAENFRWSMIRNKIVRNYNLEVTEKEVQEYFYNKISGYFRQLQGVSMDFYSNMIKRMMQDEAQVSKAIDDILIQKVFHTVKDKVTVIENPIELNTFLSLVETTERSLEAQNRKIDITKEEEE